MNRLEDLCARVIVQEGVEYDELPTELEEIINKTQIKEYFQLRYTIQKKQTELYTLKRKREIMHKSLVDHVLNTKKTLKLPANFLQSLLNDFHQI